MSESHCLDLTSAEIDAMDTETVIDYLSETEHHIDRHQGALDSLSGVHAVLSDALTLLSALVPLV